MDITCKQSELKSGLSAVGHAISSRATLPILANVLLTLDQEHNHLQLSATNLELAISYRIPVQIKEAFPSTIVVPAKLFSEFVSSLPSGEVTLALPEHSLALQISGLRSKATIKCQDSAEFPSIPYSGGVDSAVIFTSTQLKKAVSGVAFAAADDDSRPILTAICIQQQEKQVVFVAADAFQLAVYSCKPEEESEALAGTLLIPARTLTELARILPDDESVKMVVTPSRSQVLFHTSRLDMVSRLIEGTYPSFRSIIPASHQTRAVVETATLLEIVKSCSLFARSSSNILKLLVAPGGELGNGYIQLDAVAEDIGDGTSALDATVDGAETRIILNCKYLSQALSAVETPTVAITLSSAVKPAVLRPVDAENEQCFVIMPMHTNQS
jgi:DNA polymerase-3 subunit beta